MRITIAQGAFFPVPPILGGAIEKTWLVLGREFARRGHAVTHISRRHPALPDRESTTGVTYLRVPGFNAVKSSLLTKALDLIYSLRVRRVLPPADILVTNTFWLPMVVNNPGHGAVYIHVARMPKGQMRFYRRAARLQGISSAVAEAIRAEAPALAGRITSIPLPLPWPIDESSAPRARSILYVGRIDPEKGLDLLLVAARLLQPELADWRLRIVGPSEVKLGGGGSSYLESLQGRSSEMKLPVDWLGPVFGEDELRREYRSASIFVYPSIAERGETFGLAPLEAMSEGAPAVVSDLACFRDFITPGNNGLIFDHRAPDAAAQLAAQLRLLMADAPLRQRLSTEARATAQRFTAPRVAQQYLDDFTSLLTPAP